MTRVKEETIHHDQRANECALDERAVLANETEDHTFRSSGHDADDYLSVKENKNQTKEDAFKAPNHDMREDFASEQENHKAEGHVVDRATGYVLNNEISGKKEIEGKWVSTQKAAKRVHHGSSSGKQEDQGICSAQSSPRDVHVADTRDHGQRLLRSLLVASHDHPQVSSDSHGRRVYMSTKDMSGVLKRVTNGTPSLSACGTVWDEGVGEILHALGTRDEIRLIDVVCAAGIDASDEARVCELMRKGTTLSLLYTYKQDDSHGIWAHFWRNSPLR